LLHTWWTRSEQAVWDAENRAILDEATGRLLESKAYRDQIRRVEAEMTEDGEEDTIYASVDGEDARDPDYRDEERSMDDRKPAAKPRKKASSLKVRTPQQGGKNYPPKQGGSPGEVTVRINQGHTKRPPTSLPTGVGAMGQTSLPPGVGAMGQTSLPPGVDARGQTSLPPGVGVPWGKPPLRTT
jgi:hypothetical protein